MKKWWKAVSLISIAILATVFIGCGGSSSTDKSAASAASKKVIKVAFTNYYVPYDFVNDSGEPDGIEVALLKEIAKGLPEYEFKYIPTSDDDLLIGVESGKYDVGIKGVWITEARKTKFVFPKNHLTASIIGLTIRKSDADKIKNIEDFAKSQEKLVPIAPQDARYSVIEDFNKAHSDTPIALQPSEVFQPADAYTWILEGRYDGYLDIELSFKNNIVKDTGSYHKFNDNLTYIRYRAIPTYPLFNKKQQALADAYDKAMEAVVASGKAKELEEKYFGESISDLVGK